MMSRHFVIYSHKHSAKRKTNTWWAVGGHGYRTLDRAGLFTRVQAERICEHTGDNSEVVELGSLRFIKLIKSSEVDSVTWRYMQKLMVARQEALEEAAELYDKAENWGYGASECAKYIRNELMRNKKKELVLQIDYTEERADKLTPIRGVKLFNGKLSGEDFKIVQAKLRYTNKRLAKELGMGERNIDSMRAGDRKVTTWTQKILRQMALDQGFTF